MKMRPLFLFPDIAYPSGYMARLKLISFRMTVAASILLLSGCGDAGDDTGTTGALTADEARQLNEAAEMLDVSNHPPLPANTQAQ